MHVLALGAFWPTWWSTAPSTPSDCLNAPFGALCVTELSCHWLCRLSLFVGLYMALGVYSGWLLVNVARNFRSSLSMFESRSLIFRGFWPLLAMIL